MSHLFLPTILFLVAACANAANVFTGPIIDGQTTPTLRIEGPIERGDSERVIQVLLNNPTIKVVELNGIGGDFVEANKLSMIFENTSLMTVVPTKSICSGPCFLAWFGGNPRLTWSDAKLLVFTPQDKSMKEVITKRMRRLGATDDLIYNTYHGTDSKPRSVSYKERDDSGQVPMLIEAQYIAACGAYSTSTLRILDRSVPFLDQATTQKVRDVLASVSACEADIKNRWRRQGIERLKSGWRPSAN